MWERSIDWLPSTCTWTGDQTHNLGMCPDWELNAQTVGYGTTHQPAEPHWPGLSVGFCLIHLATPVADTVPRA